MLICFYRDINFLSLIFGNIAVGHEKNRISNFDLNLEHTKIILQIDYVENFRSLVAILLKYGRART